MSELGFAYFCTFRRKKGVEFMERGVHFLSESESRGFLIRAKRKLAKGYRRLRRFEDATREELEAKVLADTERMLDQKRQLTQLSS